MYKPKILIDVNLEQSQQRERELEREREREIERQLAKEREKLQKERYVMAQASRELASINAEPIDSDSSEDVQSPSRSNHRRSKSRDSNANSLNHQVSTTLFLLRLPFFFYSFT